MTERGLNRILPSRVLCFFELRQLETDPGFFQISSLYDTNILSESNAATSNKTATRSTDALLASKEEKLISFSLPVFSNGEGSNEQNPTLSGSLSVVEGLLLTSMHFPPTDAVSPFSTAGLQPTIPRELQREPSPSSLLYAAQSRTCWNHSNPILVWAQPERRIPVCMATRSASKRSQWGKLGPRGPDLSLPAPQLASPDGWNTPKQRLSPLLPRLPTHDVGSSTRYSQMSGALTYPLSHTSLCRGGGLFGNARGTDGAGGGDDGSKRGK